jgi:hypothetical protein
MRPVESTDQEQLWLTHWNGGFGYLFRYREEEEGVLSVIRTDYATSDNDEILHVTAPRGDTTRIKADSPEVWSGTVSSVMPATTVPE